MISAAIIALRIPSCIGSSGRQHAVDRSLADAQLYRDLAHAQPFIRKSLDLLGLGPRGDWLIQGADRTCGLAPPPNVSFGKGGGTLAAAKRLPSLNQAVLYDPP